MLANQMFPAALGIFMVVLVQDMGFPGWMWGILFFLPRVFDSVTDPIMGFISDNTRSRWGRRKHYVFIGAIVMGILRGDVAALPRRRHRLQLRLLPVLVLRLLHRAHAVQHPYVAMGYEMSDDFHERTSIMAVAQWIGQWAWVIAPWFWVVMYDPSWFENADTATRTCRSGSAWSACCWPWCRRSSCPAARPDDTHLVPLTWANFGGGMRRS
jgi:GPH family glycoside/pentoside/hexuronide:cation symporter